MVSVFLIVLGLGGVVGGLVLGVRVQRIRGWPTARARVVERAVGAPTQPTGGARNGRFVPSVRYVFEVEGRSYEGRQIRPVQEGMTAERAREVVDAIPDVVEVHYDPRDPSQAFIEPGSLTLAVAVGVGGALLALGALGAWL